MKKIIQLFTPPFIKQLDKALLEKYPFLWSKRLAHVLFFGLLILGLNVGLCALMPISIFNYTQLWVFLWVMTVPSVLFLLIWLFFQYKYDLAWDYSKLGWGYYFKTGLSYTGLCAFALLMILLPVRIYQERVNNYYSGNISVDGSNDISLNVADTYFTRYYSSYDDLSEMDMRSERFREVRQEIMDKLFNGLNLRHSNLDVDTLVKPEITEYYWYDPFLGLKQYGDSTDRYTGTHLWVVKMEDEKRVGADGEFLEGTINMFSPVKYFNRNKAEILKSFDSTDYHFLTFFNSEYLMGDEFPDPKEGFTHNWKSALLDPANYIETQKVRIHEKRVINRIKDHRLNKYYDNYVCVTELPDQDTSYESYYIGANIRGDEKLLGISEFYTLKRLEHFLFKRFNIESVDHLDPQFVSENIIAFQQMGRVVDNLETDYGYDFTRYNYESAFAVLASLYACSAVLALLLLTIRLLNFRLLVISIIALVILSFLVFVPMAGFNIHPFHSWAFIFLSCIYAALIAAVIRLNLAQSVSRFMVISALGGLIVLPLITLFYFGFAMETINFTDYQQEMNFMLQWGTVFSGIFLFGHIPLIARTIHRAYYLPKR